MRQRTKFWPSGCSPRMLFMVDVIREDKAEDQILAEWISS
jgi:hypothetical protein